MRVEIEKSSTDIIGTLNKVTYRVWITDIVDEEGLDRAIKQLKEDITFPPERR